MATLGFAAKQVGMGPLVGAALGHIGSTLLQRAFRAGCINHTFLELSAVGLALLAFMVFGGLMLPEAMHKWTWPMPVYAPLSLTVLPSIVLHGVTANPLASLHGRAIERSPDKDLAEMLEVEEMPVCPGAPPRQESRAGRA